MSTFCLRHEGKEMRHPCRLRRDELERASDPNEGGSENDCMEEVEDAGTALILLDEIVRSNRDMEE